MNIKYYSKVVIFLVAMTYMASAESDNKQLVIEEPQTNKKKTLEYESIFNSTVFDTYYFQLVDFTKSELKNGFLVKELEANQTNAFNHKLLDLINLINSPADSALERRYFHQSMMSLLKDLIIYKQSNKVSLEAGRFIDDLNYWIFTGPYFLPAMGDFLQSSTPLLTHPKVSKTDFSTLILDVHDSIKENTKFIGYVSANKPNSLQFRGYLPSQIFKAFSTTFLLKPRESIHDKQTDNYEISTEFLNYLKMLKTQKKKHLYINLMKKSDENENAPFKPYEKLSENAYKDVLLVATLDKNSDFYWQKNEYEPCCDAAKFKTQFIAEMCGKIPEKSNFLWPQQLNSVDWTINCSKILDSVHSIYFDNHSELSVEERQNFIEIAYLKIIQTLCEKFKPEYTNISCKDTIDRGPSILGLMYVYHCLDTNSELSIEQKMNTLTILFAPPLLAHNRPSQDPRIERFSSAVRALLNRI